MKIKKFENANTNISPIEMEIYDHLKQKMEEDCGDGGHVLQKMEEFDHSWLVDELIQFIRNNITSSYTILRFRRKYDYNQMEEVLKKLFPTEFEKANKIINGRYENVSNHKIVNFSDIGNNLSAEYQVNKNNGKIPYKKEKRLLVEVDPNKYIPNDVYYLTKKQADEYNDIELKIIDLEAEKYKIISPKNNTKKSNLQHKLSGFPIGIL